MHSSSLIQNWEAAKKLPGVDARLKSVAEMRAASTKAATQALASTPHRFDESEFLACRKIAIAQH